jgi:hypothetical protein
MEPRFVKDRRERPMPVGSEEDGGTKGALESANQPAILRSPLLHTESIEHFGRAGGDLPRPLAGRQGCQEEGHQAILAPREAVVGMAGDEENELTVAAFMDQSPRRWTLHRQTT